MPYEVRRQIVVDAPPEEVWTWLADADRVDHLVAALLRRVTGIWERHRDVLRAIVGMVAVDPQTREVVRHHQMGRRQRIVELVDELDQAGELKADREDAVDAIWMLTSFNTYDFLRQNDTRSPEEARELLELLAVNIAQPQDPPS